MSKIRLENISKNFKDTSVLTNINFESAEDEFVVIVGPSGCGKTTMLRVIAGLEKPSSGSLFLDGENITDALPQDRDIAMVFQSYALYPNLTVYDNLAFPLTMRNISKKEIAKEVVAVAEKLELTELLKRKPGTLSGGQRQRVAIGRAMIRKPSAFLLDEPLSSLDASLREKMRGELISLHNNLNILFFYVTHDQTEAMAMGDRIIILNNGIIQQIDTPEEIYNHPANLFVAGFIGTPHMNFLVPNTYRALGGDLDIPENVVVGIRPEDIQIEDFDQSCETYGKLLFVETIGKEVHYHLQYDKQEIIICTSSSALIADNKVGKYMVCRGNINKFHYFDRESGMAIRDGTLTSA